MTNAAQLATTEEVASVPTDEEYAAAFPTSVEEKPAEEAAKPRVRYLRETSKTVELDNPFEFEGKVYEAIVVENLPISVFRKYYEAGGDTQLLRMPMYKDPSGEVVPHEALDALLYADAEAIREAAEGFLSRKSRAAPTP